MKSKLLIFVVAFMLSASMYAQVSLSDFQKAKVVWYGLNFTQAKLVGSEGFTNPEVIRNDYFEKWNGLVVTEGDKYDIKGAFNKSDMSIDLEPVNTANAKVDYNTLVTNTTLTITKEDVQKAVKAMKTNQADGYGICFVVESFDKMQEKGFVWVTIFDAKTKNVLVAERLSGDAGGFGLRNYWAASVYNVIKTIKSKKYKSWIQK